MGLDMYLKSSRHLWNVDDDTKEKIAESIDDLPDGVLPNQIGFDVGYWRKANAIHKWFVDNVQSGNDDCGSYEVPREKLVELLNICNQIIERPELGEQLLPTQSGFFFGTVDYDEYYIEDIKDTVQIILRALKLPEGYDIEYQSSW